jgi:hypothetical protein
MAVVVWVYSGGGEAEVRGFFPFLDKTFPGCRFERKTPVRDKPGPKPNKAASYGRTGKSLIHQIQQELPGALKAEPTNRCDLILVFDDLDCRDSETQKIKILSEISKIPECADIEKFVGFAAPEIEAWIIADWNNSIAKHSDFRGRHKRMRWWLSTEKKFLLRIPNHLVNTMLKKIAVEKSSQMPYMIQQLFNMRAISIKHAFLKNCIHLRS